MNTLLWWLAANTVTVAVMIPVVMAGCRLFRHRPAVQHLLWVIVLVKLITPPLVSLPWPTTSLERVAEPVPLPQPTTTIEEMPLPRIDSSRLPESLPESLPTKMVATALPVIEAKPVERTNDGPLATRLFFALWVSGGLVWLAMQARRIARHRRIVRMASPAPDYLKAEVRTVADHLDAPLPPVLVSDMIASPFVWCVGRPRLVWPATMTDPADIESSRGVIAHELAHLCRRDHWVSWLELAAGVVWWWNPLFRFARRRMRESAEMACDALALSASPGHRRGYAELLLRLSAGRPSGEPAPVLGVGAHSHSSFERRLSMILSDRVTGTVSGRGLLLVTAMAMALAALPGWSPAQVPKTPPAAEPVPPIFPAEPAKASDSSQDELKKLDGLWEIVTFEYEGKKIDSDITSLRFAGEKCVISRHSANVMQMVVAVNPTKAPKWFEFQSAANRVAENRGIYEIDGDTLKIAIQLSPDLPRATKFSSKPEGTQFFVFRRKKQATPPTPASVDVHVIGRGHLSLPTPPTSVPAGTTDAESPKLLIPKPDLATPTSSALPAARRPSSDNIRVDLSALDLGERYLKADADLKIAAQKLKNVMALAKDKVVSNQEVQLYEIEMTRAERTFKLMQSFLNAELGNAEQALDSQTKQFQLVSEGYKKGILPQAELLQVRAKMEEYEARLRLIKIVADMAGK